jgi:hypothetical protein
MLKRRTRVRALLHNFSNCRALRYDKPHGGPRVSSEMRHVVLVANVRVRRQPADTHSCYPYREVSQTLQAHGVAKLASRCSSLVAGRGLPSTGLARGMGGGRQTLMRGLAAAKTDMAPPTAIGSPLAGLCPLIRPATIAFAPMLNGPVALDARPTLRNVSHSVRRAGSNSVDTINIDLNSPDAINTLAVHVDPSAMMLTRWARRCPFGC